jgi:hypothetical protein
MREFHAKRVKIAHARHPCAREPLITNAPLAGTRCADADSVNAALAMQTKNKSLFLIPTSMAAFIVLVWLGCLLPPVPKSRGRRIHAMRIHGVNHLDYTFPKREFVFPAVTNNWPPPEPKSEPHDLR